LHRVAMHCSALQCVASCCYALQCVTVCCIVLLCTAVRYSVLSARAEGSGFKAHSTLQHTATHCNTGFEARNARPQEGRGHEATSRHHHPRLAREIPRGVPKVERGMHVCFQYVCMFSICMYVISMYTATHCNAPLRGNYQVAC